MNILKLTFHINQMRQKLNKAIVMVCKIKQYHTIIVYQYIYIYVYIYIYILYIYIYILYSFIIIQGQCIK